MSDAQPITRRMIAAINERLDALTENNDSPEMRAARMTQANLHSLNTAFAALEKQVNTGVVDLSGFDRKTTD